MTLIKFIDKRGGITPTFELIKLGDMFTADPNNETIFIKLTKVIKDSTGREKYNVIDSYGEPWWFDNDDEAYPIKKITFSIEE